jgi:hypothetical protein
LSAKLGSSEKFMAFKRKNHSEKLEDFVLNINDVDNQVIIADNKIVRRFKPVFASTYEDSFFSAPFYSHSKTWFGTEMATYTYNMIIIWIMTIRSTSRCTKMYYVDFLKSKSNLNQLERKIN